MGIVVQGDIREWIERLVERRPVRVEVAAGRGHPGAGLRSSFDAAWRLVLCREGSARYLIVRAGRSAEVRLAPGEALVIAPRTWVTTAPLASDQYVSHGAVFRRDGTRVLTVRCARTRASDAHSPRRVAIEASEYPQALDAEARAWCESLRRERGALAPAYRGQLAGLLLCRLGELLGSPAPTTTGKARATWAEACRLIEERCDRPLGRAEIAGVLGIHPNHLSRLFAAFPGGSFGAQVRRLRLERAESLLAERRLTLAEIAGLCGFGGAHQLIRAFRRAHGVTPRRYRG